VQLRTIVEKNRERPVMKTWFIVIVAILLVGGAAYGVRQSGVDLVALTGLKPETATGGAATAPKAASGQPAQGRNRGPTPVETARASTQDLSDDIMAIGNLLAEETVAIAPETSGRVAEILFKDGDTVAAGAPLFRLDMELARADLAEAQARLSLADANYNRSQTLRKSGNVAQSTYDASRTELEVARTAVDSAQVRLDKLTVTAPFPGTLGFRSVSVGAYVTAGMALVQLDKVDVLQVSFSVPELQQGLVAIGQTVELTADALPDQRFAAIITAIDPSVDVNGRALQVRARLDNQARQLRPGLLVRITVKGEARAAVLVPESAIVQRGEAVFVYTVADNTAKEVRVRTGKRLSGRVEIVEGIAAGDQVVTAGNGNLRNGAAVEIVSTAALAE
jgi:membrane fusion protein (multidrug efflux system)